MKPPETILFLMWDSASIAALGAEAKKEAPARHFIYTFTSRPPKRAISYGHGKLNKGRFAPNKDAL